MNSQALERVQPLFFEAVELASAERDAFLEQRCGEDPQLRSELQSLLRADAEIRQTWSGLVSEPRPHPSAPPDIPGYRLDRSIGHGGMGSVYLAHGLKPPFEGVPFAIKVLHEHCTTPRGRRRFADEQRFLARLDHRFLARLYGNGELPDGRPYLVMDYVDGLPLDRYCNHHRLSITSRLGLFRNICSAVHYAHQNLVVHRDLKPSNILVTSDGLPRLVDFGIAKRLSSDEKRDLATGWLAPLTPAFASPEQLAGGEITTASDIYSLGRLLFFLLTDQLPAIDRAGSAEAPSPSSALQGDALTLTAWRRQTEPRRLHAELGGDLSYLVAKALRPQPAERYASAKELSDDVERYLSHRPVMARQGSWRYSLNRFCRRHRFVLWAGASTLLALSLGFGAWLQSQQVAKLKQRGIESQSLLRQMAGPARDPLLEPAALDQVVVDVLDLELQEADKQILLEGVQRLYQPDAEILHQAQELLTQAETDDLQQALNYAKVSRSFGLLLHQSGHFEAATEVLRSSLRFAKKAQLPAPEMAENLEYLADCLLSLDYFDEAIALIHQALDLRRADGAPDESRIAPSLAVLGSALYTQGSYAAAADAHRQALELLDSSQSEHKMERASNLTAYAVAIMELGEFAEAETAAYEALEIVTELRGSDHILTLQMRHNLVAVLGRGDKVEEALSIARSNLSLAESTLGEGHPRLAHILLSLAAAHGELGDWQPCISYARRAVALREDALPPGHTQTAFASSRLGYCLAELGHFQEADDLLRRSLYAMQNASVPNQAWILETKQRIERLELLREN